MERPSRLCWRNCARGSRSRSRVRLPVRLVEECDREAHERGQHQPQVQHLASGHACFSHRSLHPCHHSRKIATMIHTKKTIAKLTANTHRNPGSPISSPSLPKFMATHLAGEYTARAKKSPARRGGRAGLFWRCVGRSRGTGGLMGCGIILTRTRSESSKD